jgi:hypothetical protein
MGFKAGEMRGFFERRGREGYAESAEKKYQNEFKKYQIKNAKKFKASNEK